MDRHNRQPAKTGSLCCTSANGQSNQMQRRRTTRQQKLPWRKTASEQQLVHIDNRKPPLRAGTLNSHKLHIIYFISPVPLNSAAMAGHSGNPPQPQMEDAKSEFIALKRLTLLSSFHTLLLNGLPVCISSQLLVPSFLISLYGSFAHTHIHAWLTFAGVFRRGGKPPPLISSLRSPPFSALPHFLGSPAPPAGGPFLHSEEAMGGGSEERDKH